MYWFVVWSFVALFSYNYNAVDANSCITRDDIDRLKVGLKTHIDDEFCNIITDNGMYHLLHFVFHGSLTGLSYECLTSLLTLSILLVAEANKETTINIYYIWLYRFHLIRISAKFMITTNKFSIRISAKFNMRTSLQTIRHN